jgi:hypothetical protein
MRSSHKAIQEDPFCGSWDRRDLMIVAALLLVIAVTFTLVRHATDLARDDASQVSMSQYDPAPNFAASDAFRYLTGGGYRPLSRLMKEAALGCYVRHSTLWFMWLALVGLILGSVTALTYWLARRLGGSRLTGLTAAALLFCCLPVQKGAWIVFSIQSVVLLLILVQLLLYHSQIRHAGLVRLFLRAALILTCFVSVWYREFLLLMPALLLVLELKRQRPSPFLLVAFALLVAHGVFPMAVVKLFVRAPDLPLASVTALGALGNQMGRASVRWQVPGVFMLLFPPVILLLTMIAKTADAFGAPDGRMRRLMTVLLPPAVAALVAHVFHPASWGVDYWRSLSIGALVMLLPRHVWRLPFVAVMLLLFLLPMLRVYTEDVHLAYAALPFSLLVAQGLSRIPGLLPSSPTARRACASVTVGMLALGGLDHALNCLAVARWHFKYQAHGTAVASLITGRVPRGDILLSNVLHLEDLRQRTRGHFHSFWTLTAGIEYPPQRRAVLDAAALRRLMETGLRYDPLVQVDRSDPPSVWLLVVEQRFWQHGKRRYHRHLYADLKGPFEVVQTARLPSFRLLYPFLDPLRHFTPREYLSFVGAPDLENDFASVARGPFTRSCTADYVLALIRPSTRAVTDEMQDPNLMSHVAYSNRRGFLIARYGFRHYAIPHWEAPLDYRRVLDGSYARVYAADSLSELLEMVDREEPGQLRQEDFRSEPSTMIGSERGYNVFRRGSTYVAIAQSVGPVDIGRITADRRIQDWRAERLLLEASDVEGIWSQVRQYGDSTAAAVVHLESGYKGFNIFKRGTRCIAVRQSLGPLDLRVLPLDPRYGPWRESKHCIEGDSLEEVKRTIDALP